VKIRDIFEEHTKHFEASSKTYISPSTAFCTRLDSTPSFSESNQNSIKTNAV